MVRFGKRLFVSDEPRGIEMRRQLAERELTTEGPRGASDGKLRGRSVTVNLAESPLAWLHSRGHLDDRLFDASERLRADYERASLGPSVTVKWDAVRIKGSGDSGLNSTERQIAPRRASMARWTQQAAAYPTFSGALPVAVKVYRMRKRNSLGLRVAENWF